MRSLVVGATLIILCLVRCGQGIANFGFVEQHSGWGMPGTAAVNIFEQSGRTCPGEGFDVERRKAEREEERQRIMWAAAAKKSRLERAKMLGLTIEESDDENDP